MFDNIALKANLGAKVAPAASAVVGRFGPSRTPSIVSIAPTLDRLVVHDCNPALSAAIHDGNYNSGDLIDFHGLDDDSMQRPSYYITVRDIIRAIAIVTSQVEVDLASTTTTSDFDPIVVASELSQQRDQLATSDKDQLIICCSGSILLYDPFSKTKTLSFNTSNPIDVCLTLCKPQQAGQTINKCPLAICGGQQKLYTFKFEPKRDVGVSCELQSERSISDTINCMTRGCLDGFELLLTGSKESKIRLYELELSTDEFNIRAARLTIEESSQITCLCPIETVTTTTTSGKQQPDEPANNGNQQQDIATTESETTPFEQMNYFAFGLEGNFVGAYRLSSSSKIGKFNSERLWRHKSKYSPLAMLMYDINGDGFDELVIGYLNGRLEARSPFTGQLLAATRCFKVGSNLASLLLVDYFNDGHLALVASATSGTLVGYRPRQRKARQPLRGYNHVKGGQAGLLTSSQDVDQWNVQGETAWLLGQEQRRNNNLQSIAEESGQESLTAGGATPSSPQALDESSNIETTTDQTRPLRCESRQNVALLSRVNSLQCEQTELEKKGCLIYHSRINQATRFRASDVSLAYRLAHDAPRMCLSLVVIVESEEDEVKLVRLEDGSKNFVPSGVLLIDASDIGATPGANTPTHQGATVNSQIVVVPLKCNKNEPCELSLTVYCVPKKKTTRLVGGRVCQSHRCKIELPKYSMFALDTSGQLQDAAQKISLSCLLGDHGSRMLPRIQQWLQDSMLCLQMERTLDGTSDATEEAKLGYLQQMESSVDDTGTFDYSFVDIRRDETSNNKTDASPVADHPAQPGRMIRLAYSCNKVEKLLIEGTDADLVVDIVQSLLIDQLQVEPSHTEPESSSNIEQAHSDAWLARRQGLRPMIEQLNELADRTSQLEESETRVQSELFESANYSKDLLKQFSIACELDEFLIARELLKELSIILKEAHDGARIHQLNRNLRLELSAQMKRLKDKLALLSSLP